MSKDPRSILVVDDNEDIRNLLSLVLQKEGYEVFLAPNGSEALEIIKNNRLDLILLDVMMPELSGLEVLSNIRGNKNNIISSIPVMMITAASTVSDIDAAIEIGASSYIIKPFRNENLIGKVSAIFQEELA
ncbi:OmpR Response regulators consisting of a CheY-like receiver domain and a winged-helix DNA-binding domain [Candidatus Nanopelagicaceae bacterium]